MLDVLGDMGYLTLAKWVLLPLAVLLMLVFTKRERDAYFQIYGNFKHRDVFIEDLLLAMRRYGNRFITALASIVLVVYAYDIYVARMKKTPPGSAQLVAQHKQEVTDLQSEISELKDKLGDAEVRASVTDTDENKVDLASLSRIKSEYEKAFVNFYYLQRCGKASVYDAIVINNMLISELAQVKASTSLAVNIMESARGTYNQLYTGGTCDETVIKPMVDNQRNYMQAAMKTLQGRFGH